MLMPVVDVHAHMAALHPAATHGGWFSERRIASRPFRLIRKWGGLPPDNATFDADFIRMLRRLTAEASAAALEAGFAGMAAVALAYDLAHDAAGLEDPGHSDFYVPNSYVASAVEDTSAGRAGLLFGASIHPYRLDAIPRLHQTAGEGAVLVKWLPTSQNIDPSDQRSVEFAQACREAGIPLLIHTGSEGATTNRNRAWNDPRSLVPLLETGVTVIAAHAGMCSLPTEPSYFKDWIAMLPDWPNLYGDTASLFGLRPRALLRSLDKRLVAERLVHGSDWPVPNWPGWYWPGLGIGAIRRLMRIGNPLWRDVATKRAAGLPDAVFTRGWTLIRRSA